MFGGAGELKTKIQAGNNCISVAEWIVGTTRQQLGPIPAWLLLLSKK